MLSKLTVKPDISIIMSVYNETQIGINRAVKSILEQSFDNFELIIVNDNPEDTKTHRYLNSLSKRDKRIKIVKNKINRGLGYSLNVAISNSTAELVGRMDTEDISHPERLKNQISFIKKNDKIDLLFSQWVDVDGSGKKIPRKPVREDFKNLKKTFFIKSLLMHPTLVAKKKVLLDNPYLEMGRPEDVVLWMKLIRKGYVFDIIEKPLYQYRINRNDIEQRKNKTKTGSKNLIPHLIRESKYYYFNIFFWLFFLRIIFEFVVSSNTILFYLTHARGVKIWKIFFNINSN